MEARRMAENRLQRRKSVQRCEIQWSQTMKKSNKKRILSREEIMLRGKPLPDANVYIESLDGCVVMQNVSFPQLVAIRRESESQDDYNVAIVAAVCKGLKREDIINLQQNPAVFAELFRATEKYLGGGFSDDEIKN